MEPTMLQNQQNFALHLQIFRWDILTVSGTSDEEPSIGPSFASA